MSPKTKLENVATSARIPKAAKPPPDVGMPLDMLTDREIALANVVADLAHQGSITVEWCAGVYMLPPKTVRHLAMALVEAGLAHWGTGKHSGRVVWGKAPIVKEAPKL